MPVISTRRRVLEIIAVTLTAAGKFVFMDWLGWRFPFISIATIFWILYIVYCKKTIPGIAYYWGFRKDNFWRVMKKVALLGLIAVAAFIAVGLSQDSIHINWHIIPILILYPAWGIIQQYLLIALTVGNLQDLKGKTVDKSLIVIFCALLFAVVHYPIVWLEIGTFILALFYGWIYLSDRNIYVLGLFHGWLGGIFYYTVVDRDPFLETFGNLFHLGN